jgi:hypothetical protein
MCSTSGECGSGRACVSGRCQSEVVDGGAPAIQFARRVVVAPVDIAYVRRGDAAGSALPPIFTLGRERDGDAVLLLRFSVPLATSAQVVEAYVLLERATSVDLDPTPVALHATRIVDAWDSRTISWGALPRLEETRSPSTIVRAEGPSIVRIDVRDLVRRWPARDPRDRGIGIVAESSTPTGVAFALVEGAEKDLPPASGLGALGTSAAASASDRGAGAEMAQAIAWQYTMPRLELYLK